MRLLTLCGVPGVQAGDRSPLAASTVSPAPSSLM